jgi:hypothetical protein
MGIASLHPSYAQGSGSIPAFPAQWLYGLLRALPCKAPTCPPATCPVVDGGHVAIAPLPTLYDFPVIAHDCSCEQRLTRGDLIYSSCSGAGLTTRGLHRPRNSVLQPAMGQSPLDPGFDKCPSLTLAILKTGAATRVGAASDLHIAVIIAGEVCVFQDCICQRRALDRDADHESGCDDKTMKSHNNLLSL